MKESIKKLFAILVLVLLIVNSSFLMVVSTAIDAIENLIDENKVNPIIEVNLEKYVNYKISDESKGTLLQTNVKIGIEYEEGEEYTPIKATKAVVNLPQIDGKYPENLDVIAKSTQATNGDRNGKDMYYSYDKENGKLEIVVDNNEDENGNIYTENVNGARDEFVVISNYGADCYNDENVKRDLSVAGTIEEILANQDESKLAKEWTTNFEVTENISGLISTEVVTSDIYNGYINSNKENGTQYETEYAENMKINVSYKEISEELAVETSNKLINTKNKEIETEEIVYKSAKVNKQNVLDILGEEGKLRILNKAGEVIGEINKDTEAQEDGTVEINYENEQTEIIVKTTKPVKLGTIEIDSKKAIKETMTEKENNKISVKNTIKCVNNVQEKNEETGEITREYTEEIYNFENTKEIEIKQSATKVDVSLDKTEWTNNMQNDVTLTATLVTNGPQYDLFKNPVIEIKLPEQVEKISLGKVSLLYNNGLAIKKSEIVNTNTIRIELEGIQNEYMLNSIVSGTNIIIPATVVLKKDINSTNTSIKTIYTNENGTVNDYAKEGKTSKELGIYIDSINSVSEDYGIMTLAASASEGSTTAENIDGLNISVSAKVGSKNIENGDIIHTGEVVKYTVTLTNNTDTDITGLKVIGNVPNGMTYAILDGELNFNTEGNESERNNIYKYEDVEEVTNSIDIIGKKEEKKVTYLLMANDTDSQITTLSNINVTKDNETIYSYSREYIIKKAFLKIEVYPSEKEYIPIDSYARLYEIRVHNLTDSKITNVNAKVVLSQYDKYRYSEGQVETENYNEEKNEIIFSWNEFEANEEKAIYVRTTIDNFDNDKDICDIPLSLTATCNEDDDVYYSNEEITTLKFPTLSIVQQSDKEGMNLKSDEEVEFNFVIKNEGDVNTVFTFKDVLPIELRALKAEYEIYEFDDDNLQYNKVEKEEDLTVTIGGEKNSLQFSSYIPINGSLKVKIYAKADYIDYNVDVLNFATVTITEENVVRSKTSNVIKNTILAFEDENKEEDIVINDEEKDNPGDIDKPGDSENENGGGTTEPGTEEKKYSISGNVWIDADKDGIKDNNEEKLSGITVKLFNAETSVIAQDKNGNKYIQTTASNGDYKFENVEKGKYLVLFEFDTKNYKLTTYQAEGISSSINSDVILKNVSIDGVEKDVGLTDIVEVTDKNIENIDMGLIKRQVFDLSLNKCITKVTETRDGTSKEHTFKDTQLAKVEVKSKYIDTTSISVEYKFVITNEGEISAYVSELIDYIPEGYAINSESAGSWKKNTKGYITTTSLSGEEIKPGESKEITLILDKKLDNNSMGTIINSAEIGKTLNVNNESDIDSTEGNRATDEDDYSEAQLILSVNTGVKTYILMALIGLIILGVLFILFKHKKVILISLFVITCFIVSNQMFSTEADAYCEQHGAGFIHFWCSELKWHIDKDSNGNYVWKETKYGSTSSLWCVTPRRAFCGDDTAGNNNGTNDENEGDIFQESGPWFYAETKNYGAEYNKDEIVSWIKSLNNGRTDGWNLAGAWSSEWKFSTDVTSLNANKIDENAIKISDYSSELVKVGPYKVYSSHNTTAKVTVKDGGTDLSNFSICDSNNNVISNGFSIQGGTTKDFYLLVPRSVSNLNVKVDLNAGVQVKEHGMKMWEYVMTNCLGERPKTPHQILIWFRPETVEKTVQQSTTLTWYLRTIPKEKLTIEKRDADTNSLIAGAKIRVTGPIEYNNPYNKTFTMKGGSITINNLISGTYTVREIGTPSGYNFYLQTDKVKTGKTGETITITNRKYGNLIITKTDEDTKNVLNGVGFNIYTKNGYITRYEEGSPSIIEYGSVERAWTFYTEGEGQIALKNVPIGTYYIKEVLLQDDMQGYYEVDPKVITVEVVNNIEEKNNTENEEIIKQKKYVEITGKINYNDKANLSITTIGVDTGNYLKGVKYIIYSESKRKYISYYEEMYGMVDIGYGNRGVAWEFETNEKGKIELKNLPLDTYRIEEKSMPEDIKKFYTEDKTSYPINLENKKDNGKEITVKQKWVYLNGYVIKDKADLIITSTDAKTGKGIKDVKYIIYQKEGNTNKYIKFYDHGFIDYVNYIEATKFTTDSTGQIILHDIPLGTYYIKEYLDTENIGNNYDEDDKDPNDEYIVDTTEYCIKIEKEKEEVYNTRNTYIGITNKQKYVGISGYVWEDKADANKNTLKNDLYEAPETLIEGITVRLKHTNGSTIDTTTTGENGSYKFTKVQISELGNYYIEFEYNGLKYQNINKNLGASNGSKAVEKNNDRTNFNNSYAEITGGNAKEANTVGYSRNTSGTITNNLTYTNGVTTKDKESIYGSELLQNTGYTVASANGSVAAQNGSTGVVMKADTNTAGYTLNSWTVGVKEITNVNLGLYERAQPDLAITTDIDNVELTINGYEDTCHYNERSEYINDLLPDDKDYKEKSAFSVEVKNKNTGKYKDTTYVREIYDSYIAFTKSSDSNESTRLRVYVTYMIVVKNESSLISKVSLKNYVDTRYEKASIIASKCYYNGNSFDVNWTNKGQVSGMNVYETGLIDQYIDSGKSMTVYLTYEVTKEGILYLLSNDETAPLKHTTEIKSYSTFDLNKNAYAGIDADSAPDNIKYGNVNTYEEDTDSSPDLKLKRKVPKQISGLVFEDSTNAGKSLKPGEERKGNGAYTAGENVVENVKVELLNCKDKSIATLYSIDPNGTDGIKKTAAYTITNSNGRYTLEGIVPGQYYIEYTYGTFDYNGEGKTTLIKTKAGDVPVTTQNYKSTILDTKDYIAQPNKTFKDLFESRDDEIRANFEQIKSSNALWYWYQNTNKSSAVDIWKTRTDINSALSEINYGKENDYLSGKSTDLYTMKADTAIMDFAIEQYNYQQNESGSTSASDKYEVTFGIVERPRQSVEVTKEIKEIKLKLANTQGLVEGDPRAGTINYVTYPKGGDLKIEVDYEIIEGATLEITYEITVANKSELDYDNEEYYKYGTNSTGAKPVKMTINSVVDYMDENLKTTYDGNEGEWKLKSAKDLFDMRNIAKNVYDNAKNYNNILVNECNLELEPNKSATLASVSASKLLSTAGKMNYKNYAEILIASNDVGRFYGQEDARSITNWKLISPGSLVTTDATTYEVDDDRVDINIIPPTGDNQNIVIYTVIGISCLSLLVVGIVLIKKKVLD